MWSIGIYSGDSLFELSPAPEAGNPVLTSREVRLTPAEFVADPFMIQVRGVWYMFFEVLNRQTGEGEIGLATSDDAFHWAYQQIVLKEAFHLSYPYVFEVDGEYYMIPETLQANSVCLYKAQSFPTNWSCVGRLMEGSGADPSIFFYKDKWWLFTCSTPYRHDTLRLYFTDKLLGPWVEHPASPLVEHDERKARPGGRVVVLGDRIIRFAQDCTPEYGTRVRAFEISELTDTSFVESEHEKSPILRPGGGRWNGARMHHIDPHLLQNGKWIACVDGFHALDSLA